MSGERLKCGHDAKMWSREYGWCSACPPPWSHWTESMRRRNAPTYYVVTRDADGLATGAVCRECGKDFKHAPGCVVPALERVRATDNSTEKG